PVPTACFIRPSPAADPFPNASRHGRVNGDLNLTVSPDHVTIVGLRLLETAHINIAAPRIMPRPRHQKTVLRVTQRAVSNAGLAEVVHRRPNKITDDV